MKYSSKKRNARISNIFQLTVVSFLTLSFFVGVAALMSGGFDLRQQAATTPYCTGQNQCITGTNACCTGLVQKNDTTCGTVPVRCVVASPTPPSTSSCIAANQCVPPGSTLPCCPGFVRKNDTTTCQAYDSSGARYRCLPSTSPTSAAYVPSPTPVVGTCINPNGKATCQLAGYYPATSCNSTCLNGLMCCGPKIPNQICVPNQVICAPHTNGGSASYKCNDLGTKWTETICPSGWVCHETTRLCSAKPR